MKFVFSALISHEADDGGFHAKRRETIDATSVERAQSELRKRASMLAREYSGKPGLVITVGLLGPDGTILSRWQFEHGDSKIRRPKQPLFENFYFRRVLP